MQRKILVKILVGSSLLKPRFAHVQVSILLAWGGFDEVTSVCPFLIKHHQC